MCHLQVTVEVRAQEAGIIAELDIKKGETVAAGQKLFVLDTEGVGASAPAAAATAPTTTAPTQTRSPPPAPTAAPVATAPSATSSTAVAATPAAAQHGRAPSIHFRYGKRDAVNAAPRPASLALAFPNDMNYLAQLAKSMPSKATKSYLDLPALYGRPAFSAKEMAAIDSGGAY